MTIWKLALFWIQRWMFSTASAPKVKLVFCTKRTLPFDRHISNRLTTFSCLSSWRIRISRKAVIGNWNQNTNKWVRQAPGPIRWALSPGMGSVMWGKCQLLPQCCSFSSTEDGIARLRSPGFAPGNESSIVALDLNDTWISQAHAHQMLISAYVWGGDTRYKLRKIWLTFMQGRMLYCFINIAR